MGNEDRALRSKARRSCVIGVSLLLAALLIGSGMALERRSPDDMDRQTTAQAVSTVASGRTDGTVDIRGAEHIGFSLPCLETVGWSIRTGAVYAVKQACAFMIGWRIGKEIYRRALGPWIDRCWPNCRFSL